MVTSEPWILQLGSSHRGSIIEEWAAIKIPCLSAEPSNKEKFISI